MATKVAAYADRAGVAADGVGAIVSAYGAAVELRLSVLGDIFHPDLLHPARSILILIEDARCTDEGVLTAAALTETEFPALRMSSEQIQSNFGDGVADRVTAVPCPVESPDNLLETLVLLPDEVALIAVAERLDHARHLHFRDPVLWSAFFAQITDVYLPFSGRVNRTLEGRLARWVGAFAKRLQSGA